MKRERRREGGVAYSMTCPWGQYCTHPPSFFFLLSFSFFSPFLRPPCALLCSSCHFSHLCPGVMAFRKVNATPMMGISSLDCIALLQALPALLQERGRGRGRESVRAPPWPVWFFPCWMLGNVRARGQTVGLRRPCFLPSWSGSRPLSSSGGASCCSLESSMSLGGKCLSLPYRAP